MWSSSKHCPKCHPEKAPRLLKKHRRQVGGYSPLPTCEAHSIKNIKPPAGPGPGSKSNRVVDIP